MAYLHCHNCKWQQDDFWSWSYNPIQTFFSYFFAFKLYLPRALKFDATIFPPDGTIFSWRYLLKEIGRAWRKFRNMEWWTSTDWKLSPSGCPKCGLPLCID